MVMGMAVSSGPRAGSVPSSFEEAAGENEENVKLWIKGR
jgi:hypothetical protein